ncbi:hypothetical protein DID88_000533 [Monilinia fructigena]|uniref:non-specific serine/threonine protein kinase n=1 Tax=Monilinia fructigena TaxID=38457 RepID=A0A395IIB1_9HELO|nr:hypothetical protein DID88_000533 [Monilinia fructigena]
MQLSQLDPLPRDLPFRIISKTIGRGAYASIKKAIPPVDSTPVFAVKFIHKAYAVKHGRISSKQIAMEVSLHSHIGKHPNIIEWFATGEDAVWKWIAMEYAEGGDLFDKIEADVGIKEDIAHFYFTQLEYSNEDEGAGYAANMVDIWSCGVVLFVLLVGNTPWDQPTAESWEFGEYIKSNGRSSDELWKKLPASVLSLLRGMMNVDVPKRFTFEQIKRHPWYTRKNPLLTKDGKMNDPLGLATQMLANLRIDFEQKPSASQLSQDAMQLESRNFSFTQPENPVMDMQFDWERPPRVLPTSQPTETITCNVQLPSPVTSDHGDTTLADEPSMSQFSSNPTVSLRLTQHARQFQDILPNYSLTRFFSHLAVPQLLTLLSESLHAMNIPVPPLAQLQSSQLHAAWVKVRAMDSRRCGMSGEIVLDTYETEETELVEVRFVKVKGDPLEWRRFFKRVVVACKEGVYIPSVEDA